ncbi:MULTISPECIES: DivIVA domain-containing protein [Microbacterium]|jgi:DivIVA domain-containing protein|uniref:DivIVA domain-containing protein n=1 Tax=Microbacterium TaxID=33882 RepID=UPI000CFCAEE8|nr:MULTISPECIES: DivIVA domain-containing protein [unclassified Microbacterium]PRB11013.1 MFS transporter permease [Microbacterium sp. MYb72]
MASEDSLALDKTEAPPAFSLVSGRTRGYHRAAVDTFLSAARTAFEGGGDLTAADVRVASFPLVKNGYVVAEVDAALGRVEDALAGRERDRVVRSQGAGVWVEQAREEAQVILDHLARRKRHRFARTGVLTFGYRIDEVDHVAARIVRYLRDGEALTAEQLRSAAFRMQRGGYREEQVDALIDATVDVILAVR